MKKLCFLAFFIFVSCSDPGGPDNGVKEYAILFNTYSIANADYTIGLINSDSTDLVKIGQGLMNAYGAFSVSEDGNIIVYVTRNSSSSSPLITVSNVDDLTNHVFTEIEGSLNPTISPNGNYIAYIKPPSSFTPADSVGLYTMDVDGSNKKLIHPDPAGFQFKWKSDNSGIIYIYTNDYINETGRAYFIDKDGASAPVEVESPFNRLGPEDLEYYDLDLFDRADISLEHGLDSVSFYPDQFNEQHNKAWNLFSYLRIIPPRFFIREFFLLGYDFDKMTENELNIGAPVYNATSISWSPNNKDIAVFTENGLDIVRVDTTDTGNRILNYETNSIYQNMGVYHKWISR